MYFRAFLISLVSLAALVQGSMLCAQGQEPKNVLKKKPKQNAEVRSEEKPSLETRIKEELVPAYRKGNRAAIQKVLALIIEKLDTEGMTELDDLLSDQFLPTSAEILANVHLSGSKTNGKRASAREAALVLSHATHSIEETLDQREWVSMLDPDRDAETSFDDFERAIWDAHVYRNQIENAIKKSKLASRFQEKHFSSIRKKQPDFKETNYASLAKRLVQARMELHERELKLKLDRVDFAIKKLNELALLSKDEADSVDVALTKIWSVYVLEKDGETLLRACNEYDRPRMEFKFLDDLKTVRARSEARKQIKAGRKLISHELRKRSEHLFDGLHWWFRGRYGRGTHNLGLLKPPVAAHNIKAQNALKMPKQPPRPTDPAMFVQKTKCVATEKKAKESLEGKAKAIASPSAGDTADKQQDYVYGVDYDKGYARSPDYDRRHHYIWSQEPPMFVTQPVKMYFH